MFHLTEPSNHRTRLKCFLHQYFFQYLLKTNSQCNVKVLFLLIGLNYFLLACIQPKIAFLLTRWRCLLLQLRTYRLRFSVSVTVQIQVTLCLCRNSKLWDQLRCWFIDSGLTNLAVVNFSLFISSFNLVRHIQNILM